MRIAVVDHSYHKKTKSSQFFTEIAAECGTVDKFYCEQWQGGNPVNSQRLIDGRYDAILYWQQLYSPRQMQNAGSPAKTLLVPMYDAVADWKAKHWRKYRRFPIISFSRKLHGIVTSAGCSSQLVTYFPNVPERPQQLTARTSGRPVVFFWQRTNAVTWRTCKALIGDTAISKVIVRSCPDPCQDVEVISDDDRERFGVEDMPWLASQADYLRKVDESTFFIAPRRYEGIGMSFLEAMSLGKIVVAPDCPTMNEYIDHGRNGLLYPFGSPSSCLADINVDLAFDELQSDIRRLKEQWENGREVIKKAIQRAANAPRTRRPLAGRLLQFLQRVAPISKRTYNRF